jgi:hypothetical protein
MLQACIVEPTSALVRPCSAREKNEAAHLKLLKMHDDGGKSELESTAVSRRWWRIAWQPISTAKRRSENYKIVCQVHVGSGNSAKSSELITASHYIKEERRDVQD